MATPRSFSLALLALTVACAPPEADPGDLDNPFEDSDPEPGTEQPEPGASYQSQILEVVDLALASGFDDHNFGHFKRGRACVAGDFDNDGRIDVYMGSPGDESSVFRNRAADDGSPEFRVEQTLSPNGVYWAGSAADIDNDGDWDIYMSGGGNENNHVDMLWENRGNFQFEDISESSRIDAPVRAGEKTATASGGGNWADFNLDGHVDLFVSVNAIPMTSIMSSTPEEAVGRNLLWKNNGDGTFSDIAEPSGLNSRATSRHTSWIDIDNDGDLDLYENNFATNNVLWRNLAVEGEQRFTDITDEASLGGSTLGAPRMSFGSAVADFNHDGWQDLLVVTRPGTDCTEESFGQSEPGLEEAGHAIFLNVGGTGFVDVTPYTGLNVGIAIVDGVMGFQIGDLNADGLHDIYIGNGGPPSGQYDQLFVADRLETVDLQGVGEIEVPVFVDRTDLVDYPAEELAGHEYPTYPYRTHGTCFTDFDGDGLLEIGVINGGPSSMADFVREPNRLFKPVFDFQPHWLNVRVEGRGPMHRDAFHTRIRVRVTDPDGETRDYYNTKFSASGFSAQNGPDVHFGLGDAVIVDEIEITWPDGRIDLHDDIDGVDQTLSFVY